MSSTCTSVPCRGTATPQWGPWQVRVKTLGSGFKSCPAVGPNPPFLGGFIWKMDLMVLTWSSQTSASTCSVSGREIQV